MSTNLNQMAIVEHLLLMQTRWSGAQALAAALVVGLGVLVVAIVVLLLPPAAPPDQGSATATPSALAAASSSPGATTPPSSSAPTHTSGTATPGASATAGVPTGQPTSNPTVPAATSTAQPSASPSAPPAATASPAPPQSGWIEVDFPASGPAEITSITGGGPGFVAVGHSGRQWRAGVWSSADGVAWTRQPDDGFLSFSLDLVVRAGDNLFAFGRGHEGLQMWRSGNGRTWTPLATSPALEWASINDVAVVDGTMIAVGYIDDVETGEFGSAVWRSADGVEWQRGAAPDGLEELWDVAARGSTLVAIGRWPHLSGPLIVYSTDRGDSWSAAQTDIEFGIDGPGGGLVTVAASDRRFVAVGYREGASDHEPIALTSADGTIWTSVTLPAAGGGGILEQVVAVRGGGFVALGTEQSRTMASARHTTNGRSWTDLPAVYTGQSPPMPPEGGDEVVTLRAVAAGRPGVVVAQEWGSQVRVWFGPLELFD